LSTHSTLEAVLAWEREQQLFDRRVGAVAPWRLIRNGLIDPYLNDAGVRDRSTHNRARFADFARFTAGAALSLLHVSRLRRSRVLFVGFPRRRLEGSVWVDHFSDPLIKVLGEGNVLCLEKPFVGKHHRPTITRHLVYYDWVSACARLLARPLAALMHRRHRAAIDALAQVIAPRFSVPPRGVQRRMARALARFHVERRIVLLALAIVRPRIALLTSRWVHLPIIHACKSRGIPVCELQHGAPAAAGYKYRTEFDAQLDPDRMLTFGEHWNDSEWGIPRAKAVSIGFAYLSRRWNERRGGGGGHGAKVMLVSQPEMSTKLSAVFQEIVVRHPQVPFILKLHPQDRQDWQRRYPVGTLPNVTVSASAGDDLYDLFADCRAVIGHNSTVLFEASFFALRVGVLNTEGNNACAALQYAGRFNFHELRSVDDVGALLDSAGPYEPAVAENPFFAKFDPQRFVALIEAVERS
jgi:hypothetical protein